VECSLSSKGIYATKLSTHVHLGFPIGFFPSDYSSDNLYVALISPIRDTCIVYLIALDLIISIIHGEEYKLYCAVLCLLPPVTSSFSSHLFSTAPFSNIPAIYAPPLISETKFHTHAKPQAKV
jgi:hypothetical protein